MIPTLRVSAIFIVVLFLVAVYLYATPPQRAVTIPFVSDREANTSNVSVLFVGDMFFDRYIRTVMETVGEDYIFSCVYPLLAEADFVVGNLEGPITDNPSVSRGTTPDSPDHFRFTFPRGVAEALKRNNFDAVSLGNNHIGNFGREGISKTKQYLEDAGVNYFGGLSGDEPLYRKDANGVPLTFVAYNQFGGSAVEDVAHTVELETAVGRTVIVYAHWGEEYASTTEAMKATAARFAEAGASAVIGSHPHVSLESEYIENTLVYYSLGNFIFDQYWSEAVSRGTAVLLHIPQQQGAKISATEHTVILQTDGRVCEGEPLARPL